MPYYTGKGDQGFTDTMGKGRLPKNCILFDAIGDVDELNSAVGLALYYSREGMVRSELKLIQNDLFIIGAHVASSRAAGIEKANLKESAISRLGRATDDLGRRIPQLKKFVLPSGCEAAVHLHVARAIARRAERSVFAASKKNKIDEDVKSYLNRLSSYLFVAAIYSNYTSGVKESHPTY